MYTLQEDDRLAPVLPEEDRVTRRQDAASTCALNGAVYVAKTEWLVEHKSFMHDETVAYVMSSERSVDVDDEVDLRVAETILGNNRVC